MYSIRPHTSEQIELDLPTTMYSVPPILSQTTTVHSSSHIKESTNSNDEKLFKEIQHRQDSLLEKIERLFNEIRRFQSMTTTDIDTKQKAAVLSSAPVREELVVHLSAKQPSKSILDLIDQQREKISLRTFSHSSLRGATLDNQLLSTSTSTHTNTRRRPLTIIWADGDNLPYMFYSRMTINDEQSIVKLLADQLNLNS